MTPEISASLPQEVPVQEVAFGRTWVIRFLTLSIFLPLDKKGFRMIDTPGFFFSRGYIETSLASFWKACTGNSLFMMYYV